MHNVCQLADSEAWAVSHWWKMAGLKSSTKLAAGEKMPKSPQNEHNVSNVFVRI